MNKYLSQLHPYPFERLAHLKSGITPPAHLSHISLSIGEPKHPAPEFVKQALINNIQSIDQYPTTKGTSRLREAISDWLEQRFNLEPGSINYERHVLPVCGTREAIFAFIQATISNHDADTQPLVVTPNPFYQIYEGAALLAGAQPHYLDCDPNHGFIPDLSAVPEDIWQRCQLLQLCSPGNPTGAVMSLEQMQYAIELADHYDFVVASDECYSEVYLNESTPPPGLLQACQQLGRNDYARCVVFHSLSKRSNLPGLRSGFVAGDQALIEQFFSYRTYHGCSMSIPVQKASIAAWKDENHTIENRALYRHTFDAVTETLGTYMDFPEPHASFYLWPKTCIDDVDFAQQLFAQQNVTVLPGQFLSRPSAMGNPGQNRVRMALVANTQECVEAALRIKQFIRSLTDSKVNN